MGIVIRGGTVVTMNGARDVFEGDVRVAGGRIEAVGNVQAQPGDTVLDAKGAAVIPGLVQAHVHLCQALFRGLADDLPLLAWLERRIWPLEAAHDPQSLRASAELGIAEMLLAGTTSILDMGTVHHQDAVFEAIEAAGIRAASGKAMMDRGESVPRGLRETTAESLHESERLCGKWHGAAEGRIRYAFAPRFVLSCSEELFRGTVALAETPRALLHSHVAEHAEERKAVRDALGADDLAVLEGYGFAGPHCVLAHGVQLTVDEMKRVAKLGTRLVHCPSANMKLASGIADVRALRKAGVCVALGADGAPCNNRMDPWTELRQAALLAKVKSGDASALAAEDAFELATVEGARALGLETEIGSIEAGKRADLAVVGLDALHQLPGGSVYSTLVYSTTAADVRHVIVDGRALVRAGELTTLDADRVRAQAIAQAKAVVARSGI